MYVDEKCFEKKNDTIQFGDLLAALGRINIETAATAPVIFVIF